MQSQRYRITRLETNGADRMTPCSLWADTAGHCCPPGARCVLRAEEAGAPDPHGNPGPRPADAPIRIMTTRPASRTTPLKSIAAQAACFAGALALMVFSLCQLNAQCLRFDAIHQESLAHVR
jgi:hypothetical protein